ncbi:receptor-like protein 53 [Miscanthus floridulus]|uniref:receptor-like protein 53 n=1 Tax=Miscanthus floridulus TaxID=154761 RepID=UPI00345B493C
MACLIKNHHTTSWFSVLITLALLLPHRSNASWTNSSTLGFGGGGSSSLQVPVRCRPEHAAALLQLKRSSFTFTASSNGCPYYSVNTTLSSWIEGTDCCRWEGVACEGVSGCVTGLELSFRSLGINGSGLHPALFSLTSLKHLVLDGNHFCGSHLPASGFERLTGLEDLSLRYCDISRSIPPSFAGSTFPLRITQLKQLKVLDFKYMRLSGPIPSSIGNLSLLTELCLTGNNFSGSTFPLWVTHLKQLKVIDFDDMGLSGPIPSSIGNLSLLTELLLSANDFSGGLPSSLSGLTYLSRLDCSACGLSRQVPSLKNLSRLEFIDLSHNNLEGNIPLSKGNVHRNLQSVDMSIYINSFTGEVQASIFTQPALEYLDLSSNCLSGRIEFQNRSVTLQHISLSNNKLTGAIPTSFSQLRALTYLELDSNNFVGTLDLYPYLMLRNLSGITASNNPLLSVSADDGGDSTNNSSSITELNFASCGLARVPSVIRYLSELKCLDLSNNSIRGNIPDWIWRNMSFLSRHHNLFTRVSRFPANTIIGALHLTFNKIGGLVPFPFTGTDLHYSNNKFSSIRPLEFLRLVRVAMSINLANNKLSGSIPYMECHQHHVLQILDLSGNNLSGPVPPFLLKGCGNVLGAVNLRDNHLNGTWPDEMGESCHLVVIDLHGNQIQGRLTRSLASSNMLQELDIGGNKFVDVFPSWLGNNPVLRLLILRSNKFYGPLSIPDGKKTNHMVATGYFSGIQIIDLAENSFNGVLPTELFVAFTAM